MLPWVKDEWRNKLRSMGERVYMLPCVEGLNGAMGCHEDEWCNKLRSMIAAMCGGVLMPPWIENV